MHILKARYIFSFEKILGGRSPGGILPVEFAKGELEQINLSSTSNLI